jgi:hypothetical protein
MIKWRILNTRIKDFIGCLGNHFVQGFSKDASVCQKNTLLEVYWTSSEGRLHTSREQLRAQHVTKTVSKKKSP